jgi:hypothetical protein
MDDTKLDNTKVHDTPEAEAARRDVLISQIIDAEGDGSSWAEFTKLAGADTDAWRQLALAQRDHAALTGAVSLVIDGAADIELPAPSARAVGMAGTPDFSYRLSRWGGWAVAAAVAMSWLGVQFSAIQQSRTAGSAAGVGGAVVPVGEFQVDSAQDAISAYKELGQRSGRVLGEVPDRVIIESRPLAGGRGFEVVYLRQFMERVQVPELYQVTRDDSGQQGMLLPVEQPAVRRTNRID